MGAYPMSHAEIIRVEYEALMKFSKGDRKLAIRIIRELGPVLREYFEKHHPRQVTCDELCEYLGEITKDWSAISTAK